MKPAVKLVGTDGNAFALLAQCNKAGKRAGWSEAQLKAFREKAMAGDYDHLLRVACEHFEVS